MNTPEHPKDESLETDSQSWAKPINRLHVSPLAPDPARLNNVDGREVNGPMQGFGRMWRKHHQIELTGSDVAPTELIATWKAEFPNFWPDGNYFHAPLTGIKPGEVAIIDIDLMAAYQRLSTGVLVLYADAESFALMTPQGHVFAGWITFSSFKRDGTTVAQVEILMRPSDPFYEVGMELFGHKNENRFWEATLVNIARRFDVEAVASTTVELVDGHRQWRRVTNVVQNSAIRTGIARTTSPVRKLIVRYRPAKM